jgi:hypothetical protein
MGQSVAFAYLRNLYAMPVQYSQESYVHAITSSLFLSISSSTGFHDV